MSNPGRPKALVTSTSRLALEFVGHHLYLAHPITAANEDLCDAIADLDLEWCVRVVVEQDLDFSSVVFIYDPRTNLDSMLERQSGPGREATIHAKNEADGDPGADECPTASWNRGTLDGVQVIPSRALASQGGQFGLGAQELNFCLIPCPNGRHVCRSTRIQDMRSSGRKALS